MEGSLPASFLKIYNGYWVSCADRRRGISCGRIRWSPTISASSSSPRRWGAERAGSPSKLSFEGLPVGDAPGEGVWIYDRERWFWRAAFKDEAGKEYVLITFRSRAGPCPASTYRTSAFGVLYDETSIVVAFVRWRVTYKEVSRLFKTIRPFESELKNRLLRTLVLYPALLLNGTVYSVVTWSSQLVRAMFTYSFTLYGGEIIRPRRFGLRDALSARAQAEQRLLGPVQSTLAGTGLTRRTNMERRRSPTSSAHIQPPRPRSARAAVPARGADRAGRVGRRRHRPRQSRSSRPSLHSSMNGTVT